MEKITLTSGEHYLATLTNEKTVKFEFIGNTHDGNDLLIKVDGIEKSFNKTIPAWRSIEQVNNK